MRIELTEFKARLEKFRQIHDDTHRANGIALLRSATVYERTADGQEIPIEVDLIDGEWNLAQRLLHKARVWLKDRGRA